MNIIAMQLVLVRTQPGLVVMCKYPYGSHVFECARINSTFLGRYSLPFILIYSSLHALRWYTLSGLLLARVKSVDWLSWLTLLASLLFIQSLLSIFFNSFISATFSLPLGKKHSFSNFYYLLMDSSLTYKMFLLI